MQNEYKPISCHLYDELETLAVRKTLCKITFWDNETQKDIEDNIIDFKTKNKEEFLILKSGLQIRLDRIEKINDLKFTNFNC